MMGIERASGPATGSTIISAASEGFLARRWRGEAPLATLFWRDMIVVGSLVNLGATLLALALAAQGAPLGLAVAVHFAPLPYNLFLLVALWRSPQRSMAFVVAAAVWFIVATFF